MQETETVHYIFHYEENTPAQRDIADIAVMQEACFRYICHVLKVEPDFKIEYYLCQTPEEVGRFYGDDEPCNGFTVMPNRIYAVYNDTVKCIGFHEDAHIISYCINRPDCPVIREGLAMFFDKRWWGISNQDWTRYYLSQCRIPDIGRWFDKKTFFAEDCAVSYPIAGCFTEYLILTYGIDRYLDFYGKNGNMAEEFVRVYPKSPGEMNVEFWNYIRLFSLDEGISRRIEAILEKNNADLSENDG